MDRTIEINDFPEITILSNDQNFDHKVELLKSDNGLNTYRFSMSSESEASPQEVTLRWRVPIINMKGVWKCGSIHDKRQQYDWELVHLQSRISVDAPIVSVFGHDDKNVITFACSDAINLVEMNALFREEDNHQYCHFSFFSERHNAITNYETEIIIDTRSISFYESIQNISSWWESFEATKPCAVPQLAKEPLYSTWYQYHQNLDENSLIQECKIAYDIGYKLIIIDDGWQTMDTNRGYDYTGDWKPERFPDMPGFVSKLHNTGIKVGLWFSVPFCGTKSDAYQKFKGKFLTENHRWAPVFDPRYPEVRNYLIDIYTKALKNYNLDAFKLDFIDDFKVYPETILTKDNGRDFANVNAAVDRLMTDIMSSLKSIKSDIAIEFRQQYVGPVMRKFGNMFRAFDCPNDPVSNRIRITDVKLLCGDTSVHSDPQTWHVDEAVELAALQILNGFFGVPQMSMHLRNIPDDQLRMIRFLTEYWTQHSEIILNGNFEPLDPLANYPILKSNKNGHTIYGVYSNVIVEINQTRQIDIFKAFTGNNLVVRNLGEGSQYKMTIYNCLGDEIQSENIELKKGLYEFKAPVSGMIRLSKI